MSAATMSSAVVRGNILTDFKRLALSLDLDLIALMRRVGLDRRHLDNPDLLVPAHAILELFEIAALTCGAEDFGLRLGEARGLPDFGPLVLMLREQATLRDALKTLVSLMHLHSSACYIHLEEGSDPILTVDIMLGGATQCRQTIDAGLAGMTHILRWLLGEDFAPVAVCSKYPRPRSTARYQRFFRCPVTFLHEYNGIILRRLDLDRKLPAASPVLRRQVEQYVRSIAVSTSDVYVYRVTQVIAMALPRREANADAIAGYLGVDSRTLNRRLARAGLNYSTVVSNVRKSLAAQYMLGSDRSLSDIAELVGFASLSAFTQWFRHVVGSPPSSWRRDQQRGPVEAKIV